MACGGPVEATLPLYGKGKSDPLVRTLFVSTYSTEDYAQANAKSDWISKGHDQS